MEGFDPRPDASQRVAAKRRTRPTTEEAHPTQIPWLPIGVVGCLLIAAILFTRSPSVPPMHVAPTSAPAALTAPTSTPVRVEPTEEPTAAPSATQEPSQEAQTGRGLTVDVAPEPNATPEPEPTIAPPTITVVWPTSAPVVASDFTPPSAHGTCQFVGCLPGSALARQANEEPLCHSLFWQYGWDEVKAVDRAAVARCIEEGLYR